MAYIPKNYARLEVGYREKALKLFPWVCGRCSREFVYSNLRELTVHHIDHDHSNNPEDGSNWEMLCLLSRSRTFQVHRSRSVWLHGGGGEDAQKQRRRGHLQPVCRSESDDEQKLAKHWPPRGKSRDAVRRGVARRRNHAPPAGALLQLNGGDRLRHDAGTSSLSCCLLFITICPLVSMVMCWASVLYRACHSVDQLQAIFLLLRRQRHAIRPFSQLHRRRQTLVNFRRHTVDNLLNIHLPLHLRLE